METTNVQVTFDSTNTPKQVTFSQDRLKFDSTTGTVTFNLMSSASTALQARFPSNPIQWVSKIDENLGDVNTNLQPIDQPDGTMVSRTDNTATVTITVAPQGKTKFRFYVIVQTTNGAFFGTDPTIVTMPPDKP
jgi:predicted exporter